jgi:hypothetical protein
MDEIERSQIGKRSEPLQGWEDKPKKGIGTNYPPMRARGANKPSYSSDGAGLSFLVMLFLGLIFVWIIGMILGFW